MKSIFKIFSIIAAILAGTLTGHAQVATVTLCQCIGGGLMDTKETYLEVIKGSDSIRKISISDKDESYAHGKLVEALNIMDGDGYEIKTSYMNFKSTTRCFYTTYGLQKKK